MLVIPLIFMVTKKNVHNVFNDTELESDTISKMAGYGSGLHSFGFLPNNKEYKYFICTQAYKWEDKTPQ